MNGRGRNLIVNECFRLVFLGGVKDKTRRGASGIQATTRMGGASGVEVTIMNERLSGSEVTT